MLSAAFLGLSTVPMIFHKQTVLWFNQNFVTADVPEPKDLETWLEVGSFAWNWMEPAIGQLSFMFLVAQYMRSQLLNLGLKPYTGMLINYRCSRAVERYPELSETILTDYATTISWEGRRNRQHLASSWARTTSGNNLIDETTHRPVEDSWDRHVSAASGLVRRYPKVEEAKRMPKCWHELDNISLWVHCGPTGSHDANEERLIREIMAVKEVDYQTAVRELLEIQEVIIGGRSIFKHVGLLPYKAGMLLAGGFGVSTPVMFHKDTVLWFNEHFVTADVPEPKDLETWLEVGSFAWQWMEPLIGQLSFLILVAQYMRNQLLNLGLKPYTGMLINYRCSRAVEKYPEYSETILMDYATTISWEGRRRAHEFGGTKRMARRRSIKRAK
eukprot:g10722.t1